MNENAPAPAAPAFQSRWGWYARNKEDFLALRRLHAAYLRALRGYHVWTRWKRKAPQNRVVRRVLRNTAGQRIGVEVVGPRPEPPLCPVFVRREKRTPDRHGEWEEGWGWRPGGVEYERVTISDHGVVDDYRKARHPVATAGDVARLTLSAETVQEMLARLG